MVCAHEPSLDPRIRWAADGAARRFAVSVLGLNRDDGSLPRDEMVGGYRVVRVQPNSVSAAYYFWRLKDVVPKRVRIPLGILVVALWPWLVFDAHEFYPRSDPDGKWIDITFFSLLEQFLIRKANVVVTVNPPLAAAMRDAYGLEHVYSVPNAEPWTEARPKPAEISYMERLADGRVRFLFQGGFRRGAGSER